MIRTVQATCARCGEHYVDIAEELGEESVTTFLIQPVMLDGPTLPALLDDLLMHDAEGAPIADILCDTCVAKEFYRLKPTRKTTCCTQCGVAFQRGEPFAALSELMSIQEENEDVLTATEYPPNGPTDVYLCLSCLSEIFEDASADPSLRDDDYPITQIFAYAADDGFWEFSDDDDD